jgi:hypothetical protein
VRRQKAVLLVLAGGAWRTELEAWLHETRDAYEERAAILEHLTGFGCDENERRTFVESGARRRFAERL